MDKNQDPGKTSCFRNTGAFSAFLHSDHMYSITGTVQQIDPHPTSIAGQMLLCAINSLFENIDAEMGRLRVRVASAPTPAECAKLSSVVQALDIRHGACARTYFTHSRKWIRSDPEAQNEMDPEPSPPHPRIFLKLLDKS
jgi:hypothetical protein